MNPSAAKIVLCIGVAALLLSLPCQIMAKTGEKLVIVASTTQIADFARQVAGDQAVVKSILAPGADPHTYQVTPNDVQIVFGGGSLY